MKAEALAAAAFAGFLLAGCATNPIPGQYDIYGAGSYPCEQWTATRGTTFQGEFDNWMVGFVSGFGHGRQDSNPMYKSNYYDMAAWTDAYCLDHPRTTIAEAGAKLVEAMLIP